ncbi:MAG: hypothetical protein HC819_04220 [Cyclobacteriaceae bacterium]|nr:hypothetical protein [Cyclobacteriaceae bacterium]
MKNTALLALAFFVLLLATAGEHTSNVLKNNKNASAESTKEEKNDKPDVPALSFDIFNSVIQVSHLVFHNDLVFEFSLPVISETITPAFFNVPLHFNNYYKTLFRFIISPNAP